MRHRTGKRLVGLLATMALLLGFGTNGAAGQSASGRTISPYLNPGAESPFVKVVKAVRESVVYISGIHETEPKGQPYIQREKFKFPGAGSGFIFRQEGEKTYILTNHHVIGTAKTLEVRLADKSQWLAEVVGTDPKTDLAVVAIETDRPVTVAALGDSDRLDVGAWAIAIGNPLPVMVEDKLVNVHEQSVTVGVVSAKNRAHLDFGPHENTPVYQDYIQTDAPINGGNSGGPLFNIHGQVIGVNAALFSPVRVNIGIGFAIPVNLARKIANDLITHGRVIRAYLGLVPQAVDDDLRKALGLEKPIGVLVARVSEETPAGKAGLEKGDLILRYNGKAVTDLNKFRMMAANSAVGRPVPVEVLRDGDSVTLRVTPDEYPQQDLAQGVSVPQTAHWLGIKVRRKGNEGVAVIGIEPYSPASRSELRKGDVILEINGQPVKDWDDYKALAKELEEENNLLFYVKRGTLNLYVAVNRY